MRIQRKTAKLIMFQQFSQYKKGAKVFGAILFFGLIISTIALYYVESANNEKITALDLLWTSLFTIVGAADFAETHPETPLGKLIIFILSICGIGIVGWIIAELTGNFVLNQLRRMLGMNAYKSDNHYIICGWNSHGGTIIEQLYQAGYKICVVADLEKNPLPDSDGKHWLKGDPSSDKTLKEMANIEKAKGVIILANNPDGRHKDDIDAKTILTALTIRSIEEEIGKDIYTVIELLDQKNKPHAQHAKVDEIIFSDDFAAKLVVMTATNRGITKVFDDLMSFDEEGCEFYTHETPQELVGKTFDDAIVYYRTKNALPIAIIPSSNPSKPLVNPPATERLISGSKVTYIAKNEVQ